MTKRMWSDWGSATDAFLFAPTDARAVAWLRLAFALALPVFFWSPGLTGPTRVSEPTRWLYENVFLTTEYWVAVLVVSAVLASGWRARWASGLLVLLLLPLVFLSRGNQSRQVVVFALAAFTFLRSGVLRWPWAGPRQSVVASPGPCWPVRLMQIQLTVLYGINALAKCRSSYLNGDALVDMSAALPNFKLEVSDGAFHLWGATMPVAAAAVVSVAFEAALALGFWLRPWCWAVAILGIGFHVALTFVVQIFMLHFAAVFLYLAFLLPLVAGSDHAKKRIDDHEQRYETEGARRQHR